MSDHLILKDAHNVSMSKMPPAPTLQRLLLACAASWLLHLWLMQSISLLPVPKMKDVTKSLMTRQITAWAAPSLPASPMQTQSVQKEPKTAKKPAFSMPNQAKMPVEIAETAPKTIANDFSQNHLHPKPEPAIETAAEAPPPPSASPPSASAPSPSEPEQQLLLPAAVQLHYEFEQTRRGIRSQGQALLSWKQDGQRYELGWQTRSAQSLLQAQSSLGRITSAGLAPIRFSDKRASRSELATHFRSDIARIQFSNNRPDAPLLVGAQDAISVWIQLGARLAGDARLAQAGQRLHLPVASTDALQNWQWEVKGSERLQIAGQTVDTVLMERAAQGEYDWPWSLWLAPELGYLPVQMLQRSSLAAAQDFSQWKLQKFPENSP